MHENVFDILKKSPKAFEPPGFLYDPYMGISYFPCLALNASAYMRICLIIGKQSVAACR